MIDLKFITMNTGSPSGSSVNDKAFKRRKVICDVIVRNKPDVVLFQEFNFTSIRSEWWKFHEIPDEYCLIPHGHAPILYNKNNISVTKLTQNEIEQHITFSREIMKDKGVSSEDFAPTPRMTIRRMKRPGDLNEQLIVISWHGISKGIEEKEKIGMFRCFMTFLKRIWAENRLSMVIGGDFNVPIDKVKQYVEMPFKIKEYTPSERRQTRIIDFFIVTTSVNVINIDVVSNAASDEVLDHDPIFAKIKFQETSLSLPQLPLRLLKMGLSQFRGYLHQFMIEILFIKLLLMRPSLLVDLLLQSQKNLHEVQMSLLIFQTNLYECQMDLPQLNMDLSKFQMGLHHFQICLLSYQKDLLVKMGQPEFQQHLRHKLLQSQMDLLEEETMFLSQLQIDSRQICRLFSCVCIEFEQVSLIFSGARHRYIEIRALK